VVDIDRDTLARFGPWPWPRDRMGELVRVVAKAGPAAIGLDILLDGAERSAGSAGESASPGDAAIAAAIGLVPTVLGFALDPDPSDHVLPRPQILLRGRPDLPELWAAPATVGPPPRIAEVAAGFGAVVLLPDADGRIRRVPLLVGVGDGLRPGIAAEVARVALGASGFLVEADPPALRIGPLAVPLDADAQLRVVPADEAFRRRRTVSAAAVMADPGVRARLAGQVVLVGSSAPEMGGLRVTAVSAATPSVQIQADALETLVRGDGPSTPRFARSLETAGAVLLATLGAALALRLHPLNAALLVLLGAAAWVCATTGLFWMQRLLFDPAGPAAATVASFGVFSLAAYADNVRRARALRQSFEQHLSPEVVRRLVENPDLLRLEGESREITAIFTDIEGFTSMTERSEARKLVALLDEYLGELTQVVLAHGGMVEKVVGDSIHAIFNAPLDLPDHPRHALDCAIALLAVSEEVRARPLARELGLGRTRIGIETGIVIVGDVGGRGKLDYTAHGNAMNMASRLEAANKELGSSICIGPGAAARLDPGTIRLLGTLAVRGRTAPIEVFTTVDAVVPAT
jgi:adenylate cyclase